MLCIKDIYPSDYHCFTVAGYDVLVENEAVGEALSDLPKEKREVILLAFFLGMNDGEIAACLDRVRRTVCYQRTSSLKQLRTSWRNISMANRAKAKHNLLPFPIIAAAINGNVDAINAVVKHYAGYITALSTRQLYDENGMPVLFVDEEMRRRLETKLITRILSFKLIA